MNAGWLAGCVTTQRMGGSFLTPPDPPSPPPLPQPPLPGIPINFSGSTKKFSFDNPCKLITIIFWLARKLPWENNINTKGQVQALTIKKTLAVYVSWLSWECQCGPPGLAVRPVSAAAAGATGYNKHSTSSTLRSETRQETWSEPPCCTWPAP